MEDLKEAVKYVHEHGKKLYITANITAHNEDLKGVREYEKNIAKATELDITANMDELKAKIVHELTVEYGITEEVAREVNQITDSKVYSMRVYELAKELASDYY